MEKNILIIENDDRLVEALNEFLSQEGFAVKSVPQAYDILPLVREHQPDLLLMDFLLPGINGGELCAQLKRNEQIRHIPVIIFSAFPRVLLSLGDYGCNAFVSKPFNLSDLLLQINACIEEPERVYMQL